jgi:hypothetical protein
LMVRLRALEMPMSARLYRVRVFEDGSEVLSDREYVEVLDLVPGATLRATQAQLDELARTLARAAGARPQHLPRFYLAVHDRDNGELLFHWPAKETDF